MGAPDGGFPFPVRNVDPGFFPPRGDLTVQSNRTCVFDTGSLSFSGDCDDVPSSVGTATTADGLPVAVVAVHEIDVEGTLEIRGRRGVIFLVSGDAEIEGRIVADADGDQPGPGGNWACGPRTGTPSTDASGAGGGGASSAGGDGGNGSGNESGRAGGAAFAGTGLIGGCAGGSGSGPGGGGGGIVQISSAQKVEIEGSIGASGGGGAGGTRVTGNNRGGAGGGSGGTLFIEAWEIDLQGGSILGAGGGGGGGGSRDGQDGQDGDDGSDRRGAASGGAGGRTGPNRGGAGGDGGGAGPPRPGQAPTGSASAGGGGGGGASGWIWLTGHQSCVIDGNATSTPPWNLTCPP